MAGDRARVRLPVLGREREIEIPVIEGEASLMELLPIARAMSARATEIAIAAAAMEGSDVRCREGCAACCRQLVPISIVEARAIARAVDAMPPARRAAVRARFEAALGAMERVGLLDPRAPKGRLIAGRAGADAEVAWREVAARYRAAEIACPLLEGERCSLYDDRPIVCREYLVTSPPERCAGSGAPAVLPRPVRGSEAIATAVREYTGEPIPMVPLPLSLEWSDARGAILDGLTDAENLFHHLVAATDQIAR